MPRDSFAGDRPRELTEDRPDELRQELLRRMAELDTGAVQPLTVEELMKAAEEEAARVKRRT